MQFDFKAALAELNPNDPFRIFNEVPPASDYLFNQLLPDRLMSSYDVTSGSMQIVPTMVGTVAMDSPGTPVGSMSISTFMERTAKFGVNESIGESALRTLQETWKEMMLTSGTSDPKAFLQGEVFNYFSNVIVRSHTDRAEWLKGQALAHGAIDWTFNGIHLKVSYGVPSGNILTKRTGTSAYHKTSSKFWDDWRLATSKLNNQVTMAIAHSETINAIITNSANSLRLTSQDGTFGGVKLRTFDNGGTADDDDVRNRFSLTAYDKEGNIQDPDDPTLVKPVAFMPKGKIVLVGKMQNPGYIPGQGAGYNVNALIPLGYNHVGPTVEGGGKKGRYGRWYTPESNPAHLRFHTAENSLVVIENPTKLVVMETEMP